MDQDETAIPAEVQPPQLARGSFQRHHLLRDLQEDASYRILLLSAPAGYGKTTLLAQHFEAAQAAGGTVAWLTVDEDMSDPGVLASHILGALDRATGDEIERVRTAFLAGGTERDLVNIVCRKLNEAAGPVSLYLDDLHHIESEKALSFIDAIIRKLPAETRVVISSRTRPALKLAQLAANGWLREISAHDLRFTEEEAARLLQGVVSEELVREFVQRTEGWPAGIRLCQFMWQSRENGDAQTVDLSRVSGRLSHIADYLAEQVFERLDSTMQEFLLKTSILERISGDLANDLTGSNDGWDRLEWLSAHGLFIFALDSEKQWFRYHQLLRDFLREKLRRRGGESELLDLHRHAAGCLAKRGHARAAIAHAFETGRLEDVEEFARRAGGWQLMFLSGSSVWKRLDGFADDVLLPFPCLMLAKVHRCLTRGQAPEARDLFDRWRHYVETVQKDEYDFDSALERIDAPIVDLLIAWYYDKPWSIERSEAFLQRIEAEPDVDQRMLTAVHELYAWLYYWQGQLTDSIVTSARTNQWCAEIDAPMIESYSWIISGLSLMTAGRFDEAAEAYETAHAVVVDVAGPESGQAASARAFAAELALERGDTDRAFEDVQPALHAVGTTDNWTDLLDVVYRVVSWGMLERAGLDQALSLIDQSLVLFSDSQLPRLHIILGSHQVRLALAAGEIDRAAQIADAADIVRLTEEDYVDDPSNWRMAVPALFVRARLALNFRELDRAETLIERLDKMVGTIGGGKFKAEIDLIRAWLLYLRSDEQSSVSFLRSSLRRAAPIGQRLPFRQQLDWAVPYLSQISNDAALTEAERQLATELITRRQTKRFGDNQPNIAPEGLSPREQQVFRFLCDGLTSKEIARELNISVNTAMSYRKSLYRKLGASRRSQLVAIARGLTDGTL